MTYSSSGPSIAQAVADRDVDPRSLPSSSSSSSPDSPRDDGLESNEKHGNEDDDTNNIAAAAIGVDRRQPAAVLSNPPSHHHASHGHGHSHSHLHSHPHGHAAHHARSGFDSDGNSDQDHDKRSPDPPRRLEVRQAQPLVTHVIQTVSLVQIVDQLGSPIELQTHYAIPATVVVDPASGSTISNSNPDPSPPVAAPAPNPAVTNNVAPPSAQYQAPTDVPDMNSSQPSSSPPGSSDPLYVPPADSVAISDSIPPPAETAIGSAVPPESLPAAGADTLLLNTTSAATSSDDITSSELSATSLTLETTDPATDATSEPTPDATTTRSIKQLVVTSRTRSGNSTSTYTSSYSTPYMSSSILTSSVHSTISTETWTSTWYGGDGGEGGYGDVTDMAAPPPAATSNTNSSDSGTLSTTEKQVIGGVVGSFAGVAFLALFVLLALRYKRKSSQTVLEEDDAPTARGLPAGTGNSTGGGGDGAMAERSGAFAVTAALAGLTGKRREATPEATPERGFYRVSGRKLPSVLHTGGDGYSDPRESAQSGHSTLSGQTDYWRGSQAFEPTSGDGGSSRLALGSPMRPVSGVPIIRTGPARTPVKEENPFSDPPPRARPDSDALGDSIAGSVRSNREGPFGSGSPSRFKERI